jgi:hypothetical protein
MTETDVMGNHIEGSATAVNVTISVHYIKRLSIA